MDEKLPATVPSEVELYLSTCVESEVRRSLARETISDVGNHEKHLFSTRFTEVDVSELYQDATGDAKKTSSILKSAAELDTALAQQNSTLTVISLARKQVKFKVQIEQLAFWRLMIRKALSPAFLNLFLGFRTKASPGEKGYGVWQSNGRSAGHDVICYQLRYMGRNSNTPLAKWTEREFGIYHSLSKPQESQRDFVVILHAEQSCGIGKAIHCDDGSATDLMGSFAHDPFAIHAFASSKVLRTWRWCLDDLAHDCRKLEDQVMTIQLDSVVTSLSFEDLRHVRNIESQLLTAITILQASADTLKGVLVTLSAYRRSMYRSHGTVSKNNVPHSEHESLLKDNIAWCHSLVKSANEIQKRNDKLIQLTTDSIVLASQDTAAKINYTVRLITIITLVYLPTQFVATFFGSNFVWFNDATNKIRITKQTWIFVVFALFFTGVTFLVFYGISCWSRKKLIKRREEERLLADNDAAV